MSKRVRIRFQADLIELVPDDYSTEDLDVWTTVQEAIGASGANVVDVEEPEWLDG